MRVACFPPAASSPWVPRSFWFPHMTYLAWAPGAGQPGVKLGEQPLGSVPGLCTHPGTQDPFCCPDEGTQAAWSGALPQVTASRALPNPSFPCPQGCGSWPPWRPWKQVSARQAEEESAGALAAGHEVLGHDGFCTAQPGWAGSLAKFTTSAEMLEESWGPLMRSKQTQRGQGLREPGLEGLSRISAHQLAGALWMFLSGSPYAHSHRLLPCWVLLAPGVPPSRPPCLWAPSVGP